MERKFGLTNRLLALIFGIFLVSGNLLAQPPSDQHPPVLPDSTDILQMVDELATTLSLSREQKKVISELHFAHFKEVKELMENHKATRGKEREVMDRLIKEFEDQVTAMLTDAQKAEFEKFIKNRVPHPGQQKPRR